MSDDPESPHSPRPFKLTLENTNIDPNSRSPPLKISPANSLLSRNPPSPKHSRMPSRILPIATDLPQLQPEEDVVNVFDNQSYTQSAEESYYSNNDAQDTTSHPDIDTSFRSQAPQQSLQDNEDSMLYYPAPIPKVLIKPPILSKNHTKTSLALKRYNLPNRPKWGTSPLEAEYWNPTNLEYDESDVDSDMATVSGSDSELEDVEEEDPLDEPQVTTNKRPNFISRLFKLSGDDPDYQNMEDQPQRLAQEEDDIDATLAFSKMDPATVAKHAEMFNIGGVTNNKLARLSGEAPSLIEEIEIRKSGRKLQRSILARDANRLDIIREDNPSGHPMSQFQLPTLLQLQQLADTEYKGREQWHKKAILGEKSGNDVEGEADREFKSALHGTEETLAQRRRRMKLSKETLAERRARLKREKSKTVEAPLNAGHDYKSEQTSYLPQDHTLDELHDNEFNPDIMNSGHNSESQSADGQSLVDNNRENEASSVKSQALYV